MIRPPSPINYRRSNSHRRPPSQEDESSTEFTKKISRGVSFSGVEQELQRALHEQNFTLNKLNLDGLELCGRESEIASLRDALEDAVSSAGGRPGRIVTIWGRTGSGKSRLAQELKRYVQKRNGFFCTGKFDSQNLNEPYTAFVTALSQLTRQILSKATTFQEAMRERIRDAVGEQVHILTSLVPEIARLVGVKGDAQPSEVKDTYATRSNRLHYFVRRFIGAVCSPAHPLVIGIDDMQWSDTSSLELMSNLVTDSSLCGFLLVTTCREDEVDESQIFKQQLESLRTENVVVQTIHIENLDQSAVLSIVSTALRSSEERTFKLSNIVHQKSSGNPLYVIQFLIALYEEGLLQFNLGLMHWTWDETKVRTRFVMDNVADLTAAKVKRLSSACHTILQMASCLGQTFDKETLQFVILQPSIRDIFVDVENCWPADLSTCLDDLVTEAVIDFIPELDVYCFVHDLIQDAAFHLIQDDKRSRLQSEIGRRLLSCQAHSLAPKLSDQYYFRAVDLSNAGSHLMKEEELLSLANHNLDAGQKAMSTAAFPSSLRYLEEGLRCLGPHGWTNVPQLTLALASGAVEASYCCGDFKTMEVHIASVLNQDIPIGDKVRVYLTRILSLGAQDRFAAALETGRTLLMKMEVTRLPKNPGIQHVVVELLKTKLLLRHFTRDSILALPTLNDRKWVQAMSVIDMMDAIAYCTDINLFAIMNLRVLRWTVLHGVCQYSPTIFSVYGNILCGLGELQKGRIYSSIALSLSERLKARPSQAKTIITVYGLTLHWTASLRISLKPLLYGHKLGMETGEVEIAMYNLSQHGEALLVTAATPLSTLAPKLRTNASLMREYKQEGVRNFTVLALQFALVLAGPSDNPTALTGEVIEESEARANAKEVGNMVLAQFLENYCLQLAYYFGDYERADYCSHLTENFAKIAGGHFLVPRNVFFRGLTALALAGIGRSRSRNMRNASKALSQLKKWCDSGNVNCIHLVQLMQAETAALRNKRQEAAVFYETAINTASRNGYVNDKALAHERALLFYLKVEPEDRFWAQNHYNDAVQAYCDWNAYEKARRLVSRYGHLFDLSPTSSLAMSNDSRIS